MGENRFRVLKKINPDAAARFIEMAQKDIERRYALYKHLSEMPWNGSTVPAEAKEEAKV
jgi:hypothetical protein